jgi:hypothetical protein
MNSGSWNALSVTAASVPLLSTPVRHFSAFNSIGYNTAGAPQELCNASPVRVRLNFKLKWNRYLTNVPSFRLY